MAQQGPRVMKSTKDYISVDDSRMTEECQVIPSELEGWTKDEKYDLIIGIKHYGFDYAGLHKRVPTKTEEQIKKLIDYFADMDKKSDDKCAVRRRKRSVKPLRQVPLAKWAELLTDNNDYNDLQTGCATAVRIIADHEKFPHPAHIDNIDFKKIYHYIADAMEGKPLPDDPIAAQILNYCIMETSAMSRAIIPKTELRNICQLMARGDGSVNIPLPTRDGGLQAIRTLMSQRNYNPLRLPESFLKYPIKYTDDIPE